MQNRYVGDIGDFGKYGLLRHLFNNSNLILGIDWYLVTDETHNKDGGYISYLLNKKENHEKFRVCDEALYDELHNIVKPQRIGKTVIATGVRDVQRIEESNLFKNVAFYNKPLDLNNNTRENWAKEGFEATKKCDVIFFDPDNGLPVYDEYKKEYKIEKNNKKILKYIYHDEAITYYNKSKSVIIYNHRDHKPDKEYLKRFKLFKDKFNIKPQFFLRWHRQSVRDYLFIIHRTHLKEITNALVNMQNKTFWFKENKWYKKPHFTYNAI